MRNILFKSSVLLLFLLFIFLSYITLMPHINPKTKLSETQFSTARAFQHVKKIGQEPHFVGSKDHSKVRNYIVDQLQDMNLQVQTQSGYVMNDYRVLTAPRNIITRLKGSDPQSGSDLLVLCHYDSAPHSSFGASDDGAGVAAVLESIRAFKAKKTLHKNNIILCFTDAEEIGLLGAKLFADKHPWVKNVGLVLNFEARGTSGSSNTILETNHGNANLVKAFAKARPDFPQASSLMYSIYKRLPNDTDATVFREEKDIPSFFFAFIDGHYNYHTTQDNPKNLDKNSLAHQGSYLAALLPYFGNQNLNDLQSQDNQIFFNFPFFKLVHYDYGWIYPLLFLGWIGFLVLLVLGFRKRRLEWISIGQGFFALFASLVFCAVLGIFGWGLVMRIYPQYAEIQQGFPYNGHAYIAAFVLLSSAILLGIYHRYYHWANEAGLMVPQLFLWLLLNTGLAIFFKGASYFIIPVIFAEIGFAIMIWKTKPNLLLMLFFCIPAIFVFAPLVQAFPVALGLNSIVVSLILLVLLFGLSLPVFGYFRRKNWLAWGCLIAGLVFLGVAHFSSNFSAERPKPNSLVYILNVNKQKAEFYTYDHILDNWTKKYLTKPKEIKRKNLAMESKYNAGFTYFDPAPVKAIPAADFKVERDTLDSSKIKYSVKILPLRNINRIGLFSKQATHFENFKADGILAKPLNGLQAKSQVENEKKPEHLLTYFAVDKDTLRLSFELPKKLHAKIEVYESSNDLLHNPWLDVSKRDSTMMPRPFVLNDAIITKQTIHL